MEYKIKLEKPVVLGIQLAGLAFLWAGVYILDALATRNPVSGYGVLKVAFEVFAVIWGLACIMWSAKYISQKRNAKEPGRKIG